MYLAKAISPTGKILIILTLAKAVIIFFFYQNVIIYENGTPALAPGYQWKELVEGMYEGNYEIEYQTGFADQLALTSKSVRPPLYPFFLFLLTYVSNYSAIVLVLAQSLVTSIIAYLGYKIVLLGNQNKTVAYICFSILFIFPMNFLKSGTLDEAPLMSAFLLMFIYTISRYYYEKRLNLIIGAGFFLGMSALTRPVVLPLVVIMTIFLLISLRGIKTGIFFFLAVFLTIMPWLIRNYVVEKEMVFSTGTNRVLLFTQSQDFIENFPKASIDDIEKKYLTEFYKNHAYIKDLDARSLDKEFLRLALEEAVNHPGKFSESLFVKLKVFIPTQCYPQRGNFTKDLFFTMPYAFALICFVISLFSHKHLTFKRRIILFSLLTLIMPGIVFFMMSRHLYPVILLLLIFSLDVFAEIILEKSRIRNLPVQITTPSNA